MTHTLKRSIRNNLVIERAGFEYSLRRVNKNGTRYWRCLKNKKLLCFSRIVTSGSPRPDMQLQIIEESPHNHPPKESTTCAIELEIQKSLELADADIEKSVSTICEEITEKIQDKGLHLAGNVPSSPALKKKMQRRRKKKLGIRRIEY